MRYIALVTLFVLAVIRPYESVAAELWQGAKSGMSLQEVLRKFENATEIPGVKIKTGGEIKAVIPKYTVNGIDFTVKFTFVDNRLIRVGMVDEKIRSRTISQNIIASEKLEKLLTIKYGKPIKRKLGKTSNLYSYDVKYFSNGVNIMLLYLGFEEGAQLLVIQYEDKLGKDANKL